MIEMLKWHSKFEIRTVRMVWTPNFWAKSFGSKLWTRTFSNFETRSHLQQQQRLASALLSLHGFLVLLDFPLLFIPLHRSSYYELRNSYPFLFCFSAHHLRPFHSGPEFLGYYVAVTSFGGECILQSCDERVTHCAVWMSSAHWAPCMRWTVWCCVWPVDMHN